MSYISTSGQKLFLFPVPSNRDNPLPEGDPSAVFGYFDWPIASYRLVLEKFI